MLDAPLRRRLERPLERVGRLGASRVGANTITAGGFACGIAAAALVAVDLAPVALAFLVLSRLADGLDGAVARVRGPTALGGFLNVALDLVSYAAVTFAFAIREPTAAIAVAFFLVGYSVMMMLELALRFFVARVTALAPPPIGHTETFVVLAVACAYPPVFPTLAYVFGALCFVACGLRIVTAMDHLKSGTP